MGGATSSTGEPRIATRASAIAGVAGSLTNPAAIVLVDAASKHQSYGGLCPESALGTLAHTDACAAATVYAGITDLGRLATIRPDGGLFA